MFMDGMKTFIFMKQFATAMGTLSIHTLKVCRKLSNPLPSLTYLRSPDNFKHCPILYHSLHCQLEFQCSISPSNHRSQRCRRSLQHPRRFFGHCGPSSTSEGGSRGKSLIGNMEILLAAPASEENVPGSIKVVCANLKC